MSANCLSDLYNILSAADDLTAESSELQLAVCNSVLEYALSAKRGNLLRPLRLGSDFRVLELGSSLGSLTRYLAEAVAAVTCLDHRPAWLQASRLRCRDLENVELICGDYRQIEATGQFDLVLLVDILDCLAQVGDAAPSLDSALEFALRSLVPSGAVCLAISNTLALEQACSYVRLEDSGADCERDTRGLSRDALMETLGRAGLEHVALLYPFPNHICPDVIFRRDETGVRATGVKYHQWLSLRSNTPVGKTRVLERHHFSAFKKLEENGLLWKHSNSFLVLASRNRLSLEKLLDRNGLVWKYQLARGVPYRTKVLLRLREDGMLEKERSSLKEASNDWPVTGPIQHHARQQDKYIQGINALEILIAGLESSDETDELVRDSLLLWHGYLRAKAPGADNKVSGLYLDCMLWNLIVSEDDSVNFIDREWTCESDIDIKFILFRGLLYLYRDCFPLIEGALGSRLPELSTRAFISYCLGLLGMELLEATWEQYLELEWRLTRQIGLVQGTSFASYKEFVNTIPQGDTLAKISQ